MGMILDDARANVLLSGGAAGVAKRLAMCADILEQRKRQKLPFDSEKLRAQAGAIVARRVAAIRAQLLPSWGEGRASAMADELLVPSQAAPRIEAMLSEYEGATQGKKTAAALVAQDLIRMVRMVERSELELGLTNVARGGIWTTANEKSDALMPPSTEDENTPDFMKGHTHAREMVHEWIDAWKPPSAFKQLLDATPNPDTVTMANVNPELYKKLKALETKAEAAHKLIGYASDHLRATTAEDARKIALDYYNQRVSEHKAIYDEYHEVRDKLLELRNAAWKAFEPGSPAGDAAQSCIQEILQASSVDADQADGWAGAQVITPAAKARLRKMGYPPEQVLKDMAEFYRFTRGRVEKLRIDTKGDKRASTGGVGAHGQPGVIWIDGDFDRKTLWHEMGHHIEADPAAASAARLFIRMRASSDKPHLLRDLTGVKKYEDEIAYPDHFFHPYVGKIYAWGTTEVFSMALETFSSPSLLAQRMRTDPQTLQFVMGYIHSPQDTLQQLHLAMRQSLRETTEEAKEAAQDAGAAKYKALAAQARADFTEDTGFGWAEPLGLQWSAMSDNAKMLGYVANSGRVVYVLQADVRNPSTKRKMRGYRLMQPTKSSMTRGDGSAIWGLRYNDYPTKDFDLALAGALLFAQKGDSPWFDDILEGKF